MKTAVLAPVALVLGSLALAACGSQQPEQKQAAANPNPNAPEGISISDGRLVLPAVKGNPGAVYFTIHNDSDGTQTIRAAHVDGAKSAMMHKMAMTDGHMDMEAVQQVDVPARGEVEFKPGAMHVMAMDLADTLQKGDTTDVTLTFASGDKATFPAEILAAGDAR